LRRPLHRRLAVQLAALGVVNLMLVIAAIVVMVMAAPKEAHDAPGLFMKYLAERLAAEADDEASLRVAVSRWLELKDAYAVVTMPDGTRFGSAERPPFDPRASTVVQKGPLKGTRVEVGVAPADNGGGGWVVIMVLVAILATTSLASAAYLTRPLTRLADATRRFGDGDLAARAGVRRRDEVGAVAQAFDEMADRIERLVRSQRELLANVSHELRTPLARIQVSLDLAEDDPELARESIHDIAEELQELQTLISDVLVLGRLDAGSAASGGLPLLRVQATALDELCEKAAGKFRVRFPTRDLVERVESLPVHAVDPVLLRRAIDNLLENAAKYSPPDTAIDLHASVESDGIRITVRDRGEGIAAEDLPYVFDPFFRADRVRTKKGPGGVGLGLSLVKRIVEAHGGTIELAPAEDRGTRATIRLPAGDAG
jgi:two-component system OmpR family sensor kinase